MGVVSFHNFEEVIFRMVGHKVEDSKQIGITCQLCTGLVKQCRSEFM